MANENTPSRRRFLTMAAGAAALTAIAPFHTRGAEPAFSWSEQQGRSLSHVRNGQALWTLNFDAKEGKPYIHPLRTVSGRDLAWHRPPDHIWHRALWFSWKLINGVNYWEEDPKTGLPQGLSDITAVKDIRYEDGAASAVINIAYHVPGAAPVITEIRTLRIHPPQENGTYYIDWHHAFTVGDREVTFDRTPPAAHGGPTWGGYAGLSYRCAKTMKSHTVIDSNGWRNTDRLYGYGKKAKWMDFSGTVDPDGAKWAGVAILEHPASFRHPSPWYVILDGEFGYFSPAILFDEPLKLKAKEEFTLFYRVVIHEEKGDNKGLDAEYEQFAGMSIENGAVIR